jgi:hypothetical protein
MLYQAPPSPSNGQKRDRILSRSLPLRQPIGRQDGGSVPLRQPIGTQDGWGRAATQYMQNGQGLKSPLPSRCRGGGWQYKKYNSVIFINFISRSKKVKPKSKSCRKHFFTVYKLLRLWYFVSVLNLKFLDQLERRHCKDTPFFRPFYIGAPKGPFLPGLTITYKDHHRLRKTWGGTDHHRLLQTWGGGGAG